MIFHLRNISNFALYMLQLILQPDTLKLQESSTDGKVSLVLISIFVCLVIQILQPEEVDKFVEIIEKEKEAEAEKKKREKASGSAK